MNLSRIEEARNLLKQYDNQNHTFYMGAICDPSTMETNGLVQYNLKRDSETVKTLESLGYKVIYPAQLTEDKVARMDVTEKYLYDERMNQALVIDGNEKQLSLDFANAIAKHYFSNGLVMAGVDIENNSITEYPHGEFVEGVNKDFQDLLNSIGFQTEMNEHGHVAVSSKIPYPAVKKSKFKQIYDKAKGKIQESFAKLKSLVNSKNKVKENNTNERE